MSADVLKDAHVLLLEDVALINMAMVDLLQEMGCRVTACMYLHEAFAALENSLPQAAVLDVNINGLPCYGVAEKLDSKGVPIIFLTGYAWRSVAGKWTSYPHYHKPCAPAELEAALVQAVTAHRPR